MKAAQARILLTGATGGIGQAAAVAFLKAGACIMMTGRSAQRLAEQDRVLRSQVKITQEQLAWRVADLGDPAQLDALAQAAAEWGCNVVVHGAGAPSFGPLHSHNLEGMQQVLSTNLLAPMALTQAMLPHLRRLPRAQVLFVGSVLGRIGLPGYSVYSASKFGLRGFAEALRRELAGSPVKVQYLGPRSTRTGFNNAQVEAYNRETGTASDSPELVAKAMVNMLEKENAERFLGFPEKLGVRINGLAPTLLDGSFKRHSQQLASLELQLQRNEK